MTLELDGGPAPQTFVKKGLLPENLPPVIRSTGLWDAFSGLSGYQVTKDTVGSLSPYNSSKRGNQRRIFSIPHPLFVYDSAVFFEKHWQDIRPLLDQATGSLSIPNFPKFGPRATRITPHSQLPIARLRKLAKYKYCLVTDVSRCYPSIYTHSIPWAINGRASSKADTNARSATVFGNRLDFIIRQGQDRQTVGIPVGPDTSRVISEIVLSSVDREFLHRCKQTDVPYLRHVDDYWIGGNSAEECETYLQHLRAALSIHELDINELKTKIVSTKHILGEHWPSEFEQDILNTFAHRYVRQTGYDPISTLSKIVSQATENDDDGMIRHAIRKMDDHQCWDKNWHILEHFLAQSATHFPHSFDYVARVVAWRIRIGQGIDKPMWTEIALKVASQNSVLGRDSETIWALWLLKELGEKLPTDVTSRILRYSSPLVLAFVSHMYYKGLTRDKKLGNSLWSLIDGNLFTSQWWPLSLELNHLGIANPAPQAVLGAEEVMRLQHEGSASIVDWDARPAVFSPDRDDDDLMLEDEPDHAIEDYTSDYDDEEEEEPDHADFDDLLDPGLGLVRHSRRRLKRPPAPAPEKPAPQRRGDLADQAKGVGASFPWLVNASTTRPKVDGPPSAPSAPPPTPAKDEN